MHSYIRQSGNTAKYISTTIKQILAILVEAGIGTITKIRRETIERWIADEIRKKNRSPKTINNYITSFKLFTQYLADIDILAANPLKSIRKLNEALDKRKNRRALTTDEIARLLKAAQTGNGRLPKKANELVLIYRLLIGTGLRSTELSLLTPNQIDFEKYRLRIDAAKTKNKKPGVLPMRPDLVHALKDWIQEYGIESNQRIFRYNSNSLRRSFYRDLELASIDRKDADGRSVDVHSLRKTFGTLLALVGVPLTTVQRLMRHSTPLLTAKLYIDVDPINMMDALEKLPGM